MSSEEIRKTYGLRSPLFAPQPSSLSFTDPSRAEVPSRQQTLLSHFQRDESRNLHNASNSQQLQIPATNNPQQINIPTIGNPPQLSTPTQATPIQTHPQVSTNIQYPQQQQQQQQKQQILAHVPQDLSDFHSISTQMAQKTLQNAFPHFDRFWHSLGVTFNDCFSTLNHNYNQEIKKARSTFQELAKAEIQRAVIAEKLQLKDEVQSLAVKYKLLQKDNSDKALHIERMTKLINEIILKFRTAIAENEELKQKLERSENELAATRSTADVNHSSNGSEVADSHLPSEVVNKIRQSVAEKFETQLAQATFESRKYKKRCADLEKRLKDLSIQEFTPPTEIIPETFPPNPDESLSPVAIVPFRSKSPTPIKTEEQPLIFSGLPRLQEIIDLTDDNDVSSAPSGQSITENNSNAGSDSVLVNASPSASSPKIPFGPFTFKLALKPQTLGDGNETDNNEAAVEHRAKRRRTCDDADDHSTYYESQVPAPNAVVKTEMQDDSTVDGRGSNDLWFRNVHQVMGQSVTSSSGERSDTSSDTQTMQIKLPSAAQQSESTQMQVHPTPGSSDEKVRKSMSIKHYTLAYAEVNDRMVCRMCIHRKSQVDKKSPVSSFPLTASLIELGGHLEEQHPSGFANLLSMGDAEIAEMRERLAQEMASESASRVKRR